MKLKFLSLLLALWIALAPAPVPALAATGGGLLKEKAAAAEEQPVGDPGLLMLVNGQNPIPAGYTPTLAQLGNGHAVDSRAYDDLLQMLADCRAAGASPLINSSFRTWEFQQTLYNNKTAEIQALGYPEEEARAIAATWVAPPGMSEHQVGLALDIVDIGNQNLTAAQANTTAQQWLMAHCWDYGFILRYAADKTEITGVMYEPWHYRYVGRENAKAIQASGLCLEEYLAQNPAAPAARPPVRSAGGKEEAEDLIQSSTITLSGSGGEAALLRDGDESTGVRFTGGGTVTLRNGRRTAALYLVWDVAPKSWSVNSAGGQAVMGKSGYLHQYAKLPEGQTTVEITFEGPAVLCELRQLTEGTPPSGVQDWKAPLKDADMLLLPTHADDEFLYFGGAIPAYTARGKTVQVAYMVNHRGEPYRQHELLNGLWTAGIRNYPVIPARPDRYSPSLSHAKTIYDPEALLAEQVELIRRFRPEVIIGHDINGEYGHGAHRLNAASLQQAVVAAADKNQYPESVRKYGVWNTPKTYLHLWAENTVVMDWNRPLATFGGGTAFETASKAYACHVSQQDYFRMERAGPYDCRKFGLWRTTVGEDVQKDDFFEHIK